MLAADPAAISILQRYRAALKCGVQLALQPAGSLRLADLGFYDLSVFAALDAQGAYWLSKLQTNSLNQVGGACARRPATTDASPAPRPWL